jgi:hypothetical protein
MVQVADRLRLAKFLKRQFHLIHRIMIKRTCSDLGPRVPGNLRCTECSDRIAQKLARMVASSKVSAQYIY